jgi:hypothetical protein
MDFALHKIMHAFDGKNKSIQYKIAADINSTIVDDSLNIYDMIQGYCADIAAVGDGKQSTVNSVNDSAQPGCGYCKIRGHKEEHCRKKKFAEQNSSSDGPSSAGTSSRFSGKCNYCNKPGHKESDCRNKTKDTNESTGASAEQQASPPAQQVNTVAPVNQGQIQALINHLQSSQGTNPVNCINMIKARINQIDVLAVNPNSAVKPNDERILLSLCDGAGCVGLASRNCGMVFDRFIAVEQDQTAKLICSNVNNGEEGIPAPDHDWHSDVYDITEDDIASLGTGNIKLFAWGAPCEDMSLLRLLRKPSPKDEDNPRPGLAGPKGKVFLKCIQITNWVLKHNPQCEWFIENVVFKDLTDDWNIVCAALGQPLIINAALVSFTKRNRAYWSNFKNLPSDIDQVIANRTSLTGQAFKCMNQGRNVQTYKAYGQDCIRPIGKSWTGNADSPKASTSRPVLVDDERFEEPQHLTPEEAEKLTGMSGSDTAGNGVSSKDRLKGIGNGWDINVANMIFSYSALATRTPEQSITRPSKPASVATAAGYIPRLDQLSDDDIVVQDALVYMADNTPSELASAIATADSDSQLLYLSLLKHHYSNNVYNVSGAVLDSGSSKHLDSRVYAPNSEDRKSLSGFDSSQQWTEANGYLPLTFKDSVTGENAKIDIEDVDQLAVVSSRIFSMGKLIRLGYKFYFEDETDLIMITPGGANKVKVELGDDDIVRLPNEIRTGHNSKPLPKLNSINALRRTAGAANAAFLHEVFNHCSSEKVFRTLGVTKGYKQVRLGDVICDTCARAKAKSFGLSRKHLQADTHPVHLTVLDRQIPIDSNTIINVPTDQLQALIAAVVDTLSLPKNAVSSIFDDDDDPCDDADLELYRDEHYKAPTAGRELGVQPVPRFDMYKLQPFELMFVDNKDYDFPIRGGAKMALIFIDFKTRFKTKVDLTSKVNNGNAFAQIISMTGAHKLDYSCRVLTDGCGSMAHVKTMATRMGIDHAYIPPHQQSLNEAEKVADQMWAAARAHVIHAQAPNAVFSLAVDFSMYADMRTATTDTRDWLTPYEMIKGVQPSIAKLHRFYTKAFVTVPKSKRKALAKKGVLNIRGEDGRFVGFHDPFSSTYAVLLEGNRLVHSLNVTFNDANHSADPTQSQQPEHGGITLLPGNTNTGDARPKEATAESSTDVTKSSHTTAHKAAEHNQNPLFQSFQQPYVQIEPMPSMAQFQLPARPEYFDIEDDSWNLGGSPQPRIRPSYKGMHITESAKVFLSKVTQSIALTDLDHSDALVQEALDEFINPEKGLIDHGSIMHACYMLAQLPTEEASTKDMNWSQAMQGPDRDSIIEALLSEESSLEGSILEEITTDHPDYDEAVRDAISGRYLLDLRRSGQYKARGVKQGFKEDKATADGPGFSYYSHMAKLTIVRMLLFRRNRGNRKLAIKDVCTAFLQSKPFPPHIRKFMKIRNPFTGAIKHYRQHGPIYGEASAPIRWEDTLAPELEDAGFSRGQNQPTVFLHEDRDLAALIYVDDGLADGINDEEIAYFCTAMEDAFDCKETVFLKEYKRMDFLGMEISMDREFLYLSMVAYIENSCDKLFPELNNSKPISTPIDRAIETDSPRLDAKQTQLALTVNGHLGWIVNTVRCDCAVSFSCTSQQVSAPTEATLTALKRIFQYLKHTSKICLASRLYAPDIDPTQPQQQEHDQKGWQFYTDSNYDASRSRNGFLATEEGAPVGWHARLSSVAFAHPDIGEAHSDTSSGAAEVYAAANATHEILELSYAADDAGIDFPQPAILQMDNAAAEAFTNNSSFKSKLKHIDCRQQWVRTLRDKSIVIPEHVPTADNLADLFTKILPAKTFIKLRDQIMHELPDTIY